MWAVILAVTAGLLVTASHNAVWAQDAPDRSAQTQSTPRYHNRPTDRPRPANAQTIPVRNATARRTLIFAYGPTGDPVKLYLQRGGLDMDRDGTWIQIQPGAFGFVGHYQYTVRETRDNINYSLVGFYPGAFQGKRCRRIRLHEVQHGRHLPGRRQR